MKNMKFKFFGVVAMAAMLFFAGCDSDGCKDVDCGTNGTCVDGTCVCDDGYEGDACGDIINAKFAGSYNLTETCSPSGAAGPYTITVTASNADNAMITFNGLWEEPQAATSAMISLTTPTNFTIASQTLSGSFMISGDGSYNASNGEITINYEISNGGSVVDECSGVLAPQ